MADNGLANFNRRMAAIKKEVREAVTPALMKGAGEITDMMRIAVPKDGGDLRDSIAITPPGGTTPPGSTPKGTWTAGETEVVITVGNEVVRYPALVEYGTKNTPAQPFFWPAVRLTKTRVQRRIKRAITKAVKDNWNGS